MIFYIIQFIIIIKELGKMMIIGENYKNVKIKNVKAIPPK
jgi:hypothetical protein